MTALSNVEIHLLNGGFLGSFAECFSLKRSSYACCGGLLDVEKVHFNKFKMFLACDQAIDCVKAQPPTEMTSVTRLALATSEARVCEPGWSEHGEVDVKHLSAAE